MRLVPTPSIWVPLHLDGLLILLPTEVLEGGDCPGVKRQLVLQKDLYTYLYISLSLTLHP
jgi:hypothetical protein